MLEASYFSLHTHTRHSHTHMHIHIYKKKKKVTVCDKNIRNAHTRTTTHASTMQHTGKSNFKGSLTNTATVLRNTRKQMPFIIVIRLTLKHNSK